MKIKFILIAFIVAILSTTQVSAHLESECACFVQPTEPPTIPGDPVFIQTSKSLIPDFAAYPTITSVQDGNWFTPTTWSTGFVPTRDDVVKVSHTVTYEGVSVNDIASIGVDGELIFSTTQDTLLKVGTILVYTGGLLQVGSEVDPISRDVNTQIIFSDRALATVGPDLITNTYDPDQWGTGIIALGTVTMYGAKQDKTWLRLAQAPLAGDNSLILESAPVGWAIGDRIVIPDTRQTPIIYVLSTRENPPLDLYLEESIIAGISGNTLALVSPLTYDHLGGTDTDGNLVALPHVGNISRNILIRSENPDGVKAHGIFTERAKVNIQNVAFVDMGRTTAEPLNNTIRVDGVVTSVGTNQIGRYPFHAHHLMGRVNPSNTGYQFVFSGNSVVRGGKWGVAIHNSHFGLIDNNVIYDTEGSAIITEQANERENVFSNNFAVLIGTPFQGLYSPRYGGVAGFDRPLAFGDFGYEGTGLWFSGNDHYVTGNVVANAAYAGVMYNARIVGFSPNLPTVPKFRGADIATPSDWKDWLADRSEPAPAIRVSSNNEVYASAVGTWVSFAGEVGSISDYLMWNIKQIGMYSARNTSVSYDNITIVSDQDISNQNHFSRINVGLQFGNRTYQTGEISFTNSRVEGFTIGVNLPNSVTPVHVAEITSPVVIFDNVDLRNFVNAKIHAGKDKDKYNLFNNVSFVQNDGPANRILSDTPRALLAEFGPVHPLVHAIIPAQTYFFNYNRIPSNDFEYYFREQDPDYVMVARIHAATGLIANANCPTVGLTNAQCFAQHGVAMLGSVASCDDELSRPEIDGFTCPVRATESLESILNK